MITRKTFIPLIIAVFLVFGCLANKEPKTQTDKMRPVRTMNITGEIAETDNGYIIRGSKPSAIFTILNPVPTVLDEFVKSSKTVSIETRIVSGDNVEIKKIDGKEYPKSTDSGLK